MSVIKVFPSSASINGRFRGWRRAREGGRESGGKTDEERARRTEIEGEKEEEISS